MKGRPPKPEALKRLHGTSTGGKLVAVERGLSADGLTCPRWLRPEARAEWRRVCKSLTRAGIVVNLDRAVLAAYCQAWAKWREAEEAVVKDGQILKSDSGTYLNPALNAASMAHKQLMAAVIQLGLTPVARERLGPPPGEKQLSLADVLFAESSTGVDDQ